MERKHKFGIDDVNTKPIERCFGVVTDAEMWRFLEHTEQWDSYSFPKGHRKGLERTVKRTS